MAMRLSVAMFAIGASAYELPSSMSRRAVLSRVAAAAPLAAVAPVFADANNAFLGSGKDVATTGVTDSFAGKGTRFNKGDSKLVDDAGAAVQPSAKFTPAQISASAPPRAVAGVRIAGKYSDPAHPGCKRKVTLIGTNKVLIEGADEVNIYAPHTALARNSPLFFSPCMDCARAAHRMASRGLCAARTRARASTSTSRPRAARRM